MTENRPRYRPVCDNPLVYGVLVVGLVGLVGFYRLTVITVRVSRYVSVD